MAIGGFRTASEVTRPVKRNKGGAAEMLRFGDSIPRLTGAGEGFRAIEQMAGDVQRYSGQLRRKAEEIAERDATEAAQKLQAQLGDEAMKLYQRQGTSADGIAGEWEQIANERVKEVCAGFDSMTRERLKSRIAPWLAGRRENLMMHQFREVRRGRILDFENDMISLATGETNDIIAQARGEEARWNEELVVAKKLDEKSSGSDGSKVDSKSKKGADRITEERRQTAQRHLAQLGVVTFGNEDRFSQAVKEGLFSEEEATERRREHRGNTLRTTLDALIKDGLTDSAESILDELEGNGSVLAVECGIDARQMSAFRNNVNLMRQRKQAEVERAQAEAREIARKNAIEKEIKFLQAPIPVNAEAQAAHLKRLGTEYAALADDPTLDASTRLAYIKTARSLGYQSMELKEGIRAKEEREKMRSANAKVDAIKAERDFNEESLAASLNQLRIMELDGTIDQTQANAAQAAIWRKFATLTYEKKISPTFMHSFQGRIMSRLSAQEQNAMRKFYRAFGYVGDITDGSIAAKDRKASESEDFYAPYVEEDKVVRGNANAISGKQLFEYGEALLRTLRTLDPGMNREGVIDAEIQRLKTHWQKGKFDENRDASVRAILEMQRETKMLSIIDSNSKKTNQNEKKQDEK